jgi:hypothetical protein
MVENLSLKIGPEDKTHAPNYVIADSKPCIMETVLLPGIT